MDTDLLIQSTKEDLQLLLCPYCVKQIPFIELIGSNGEREEFLLKLKCSCFNNERQIQLRDYFDSLNSHSNIKSQLDNQLLNNIDSVIASIDHSSTNLSLKQYMQELKNNVMCETHNQPFAFYDIKSKFHSCIQCNACTNNHHNIENNTQIVSLKPIDLSALEDKCKQIDLMMCTKKSIINHFFQTLDKLLSRHQVTQLEFDTYKTNIENTFKQSERINKLLALLYKSFYHTASFFSKYPCYQLLYLLNTLKINNQLYMSKEGNSIQDYYLELTQYLNENIITQIEQYTCIASLSEHSLAVWTLKLLHPNQLASASYDTTVKLWDLSSFKCTSTLIGHRNSIFCLMNCDQDQLISCSGDRTIKIWNTAMSKCNTTLTGYKNWIYCMIKLSDNNLVSGAEDGTIAIWSLKSFQCNKTIKAHQESVTCLVEMSNRRLASGSKDCSIRIWSLITSCCITIIEAHSQTISCIAILDDESLASGSSDELIKIWCPETYKLKMTINHHKGTVWCLLPLVDHRLASCSDDRTINIWSITDYHCIATLRGHLGGVCTMIAINEHQIASGSRDSTIKIWNI